MYHILSRYVRDPDKIVNEVMQSQRGDKEEIMSLKVTKLKKRKINYNFIIFYYKIIKIIVVIHE